MKKNLIIFGIVVLALLVGAYFVLSPSNTPTEEFDPSVYFEGEPISQEEIEKVLTKEEREEIDRMYNEQAQ